MLKIASHCFEGIAGRDKPPPLQARPSIYLKSSGGVYPRPIRLSRPPVNPINQSTDDSALHFRTHFGLKMNAKINNANDINK